jgi:hypothetical protein
LRHDGLGPGRWVLHITDLYVYVSYYIGRWEKRERDEKRHFLGRYKLYNHRCGQEHQREEPRALASRDYLIAITRAAKKDLKEFGGPYFLMKSSKVFRSAR